jgi:sugar/nucleoside kinase (ribokinase family)
MPARRKTRLVNAILVAGHICLDIAPTLLASPELKPGALAEIGRARLSLGGSVGNTAKALLELGRSVRVSAALGQDDLSLVVQQLAVSHGIDAAGLGRFPGADTSYSIVLENPDTDRTIWHFTGANDNFRVEDVDLTGVSILHVGYPSLVPTLLANDAEPLAWLLREAKSRGISTSLDLAVVDRASAAAQLDWERIFRAVCPFVDIFSPSLDDLASVLDPARHGETDGAAFARMLVDLGAAVVAVSAGAAGVYVNTAKRERLASAGAAFDGMVDEWCDQTFWVPAERIEDPITTNGAGDAASAGLLAAIDCRYGPGEAVRFAVRAASARIAQAPMPAIEPRRPRDDAVSERNPA